MGRSARSSEPSHSTPCDHLRVPVTPPWEHGSMDIGMVLVAALLARVVEMAGMVRHCDFAEQATVRAADGRLRPDLIVHLAGGRHVVVDAKVPLAAYLDALEADDDGMQRARLADHARQLRAHVM